MKDIAEEAYWCPRCGTLRLKYTYQAPELVDRVTKFWTGLPDTEWMRPDGIRRQLQTLGIIDAITND